MLRRAWVIGVVVLLVSGMAGMIAGMVTEVRAKQPAVPLNCFVVLRPGQEGGGGAETFCEEEMALSTPTPPLTLDLGAGQHCVVEIHPLQPGESASEIRPVGCFATFSEAIAAATGGDVQLSPDVGPDEVTEEMLVPAQRREY